MEIKRRIAAVEARLSALDQEAGEIAKDQARLRENLKALEKTAEARQLIARYIAKAGEQESRLEEITSKRRAGSDEKSRLQPELAAAVRALEPKS
jgi:chromosome segregation ATPase